MLFAATEATAATQAAAAADPWRFQPHPGVWLMMAGVVALGVYVDRVIAPKVPASERGAGPAVTARQKAWFGLGVVLLWAASDYPVHDVAEQHLYSIHMVQHLVLTLLVPPVFWLATPEWLARLVVSPDSPGRGWAILGRLARPVPAAVIFNALVLGAHWTAVVNTSVQVGAVHFGVHLVLVAAAFLMWIPVCGPWPSLRLSPPGACVYLFVQSIVPTVPGAWLSLSDSVVYAAYDHGPRLWGISALEDQQIAGLFMKLAGGAYLWTLIIIIFFRWALAQEKADQRSRFVTVSDGIAVPPNPASPNPDTPDVALTFDQVQAEFDRSPSPGR
jgi:putative membrane protein